MHDAIWAEPHHHSIYKLLKIKEKEKKTKESENIRFCFAKKNMYN